MSEAYVHGFNLVLEGVRQMPRHVDRARSKAPSLPGDERRRRADERAAAERVSMIGIAYTRPCC